VRSIRQEGRTSSRLPCLMSWNTTITGLPVKQTPTRTCAHHKIASSTPHLHDLDFLNRAIQKLSLRELTLDILYPAVPHLIHRTTEDCNAFTAQLASASQHSKHTHTPVRLGPACLPSAPAYACAPAWRRVRLRFPPPVSP